MCGMPLSQALAFAMSVVILLIATERWRFHPFLVIVAIASAFGLVAGFTGTSSSPSSAFALLTPLLRPFGGDTAQSRERATIALALAISSSHGHLEMSQRTRASTGALRLAQQTAA
jgi:hypothetical protein